MMDNGTDDSQGAETLSLKAKVCCGLFSDVCSVRAGQAGQLEKAVQSSRARFKREYTFLGQTCCVHARGECRRYMSIGNSRAHNECRESA